MDPPVRKRGRPRKEEQPKRGRPKANVDVTRKSVTSQISDTEKEKKVENINASDKKQSGEIKTRSAAVKDSASSKLRPPKPPPYTNKEKWNRMNNGQKLYAMRQYNLSLIRRGLPVDKTLPGSFNFKSSNFTFGAIPYGSVKKTKNSDSSSAKSTQPNTVIKPKSSDSNRSKNDQPDSRIDFEILPSVNFEKTEELLDLKKIDYKIEKIEKALGLKKAENKLEKTGKSLDSKKVENKLRKTEKSLDSKKDENKLRKTEKSLDSKKVENKLTKTEKSLDPKKVEHKLEKTEIDSKKIGNKEPEKKLEASEKTPLRKKIDPLSEDESSDDSDSETEESGTEREMPDLDLYKAEEKQPSTQKEIQIPNLSISNSEKIGSKRVMKVSVLSSAKGKQKEIQTPDLSGSNSEKIGTKKEMKYSGFSSAKGTQKEIQTSNPSGSNSEKMGTKKEVTDPGLNSAKSTIKKIPILNHAAVENKQSESAKKTDVKIRTSVYTFTTKCDRQRRSTGILTKKPISVVSPKKISTITMKYRERNRKATKPDEIPTLTKEVDTAGNDSNVIIIQKKVPEKQNLANTSNSLKTKHGANSDDTVPAKKLSETDVECQEQNISNPDVKQFLEDSNGKENAGVIAIVKEEPVSPTSTLPSTSSSLHINNSEVLEVSNRKEDAAEFIAVVKEEPESPSSTLPSTSSLHINNPEGTIPVEKLSITEMECKEQRNSNPDERRQDSNGKENAAEVAFVKEEEEEPERPISSLLHASSVVQKNNPENIMAVQSIPTVEMTLEKQSTATTNPSGRSSRLSIRVKSIDSSSLETNSDGSPSTLSLIRQILEDQNPRMINPYVCPSDVSVVKIPVKISRLNRSQNSKITNSIGNPLVAEKLDCQESTTNIIKEEPQNEESESQNLLKNKTCPNSEDTKNTSDVMKTGSISDVLDHEIERAESVGESNLDVLKTNSTSDILDHDKQRIESIGESNLDFLKTNSTSDRLEHDTEIIELVEKTNLDVLENDSASDVLEHIERHADVIASVEDTNLDIVNTDFHSVVLEPETEGAASAEDVELDKAILNSPEDISNAEFCEKKDEEKELSITQLNNTEAHVSEVATNELEAIKATESDIGKIVDLEAVDSNLTDTTETEESDMVTEDILDMVPQTLETITETNNMDIRENTKVKMQSFEEAVLHFPEIKCKSFQALKDNNLDSSLHSTRMYKKLPECFVVLHRLTEEDLHKSYPSESEDNYGISYDVKRKTDELCETVEGMDDSEREDGNFRIVRRIPRSNASAFELYKQKRERYMNRRNRAYHSENSLDMSQDESRTFSDGAKPKKKLKRGRRYERDFEWRPDIPKGILNSDRKLRRRTSVIESDSSSSSEDDEEFMYNLYIGYDDPYGNEETASSNAVPSDDTSSTAASNNCELEKQPSDKYSSSHQNSSQSSELKSTSQSVDPGSFDIVSGIIKNMENQHHSKLKTSYNTSQHSNTKQSNDFIKTEQKKRKRPRLPSRKDKNSEIDPNKIVASILKEMVNKVSSKLKKCPEKQINKASKICKWCTTPFQPNRSSDVKCAICTDLGNGEVNKSLSSNKKSPNTLKIKCFKENKGKKTNSAMSRVLKKLSENEKQRLIYSEKSDTKTSGKGYNHCKSFLTPKDTISKSESNVNLNASQNKMPNKLSLKGNKISTKLNQKNNKSDVNVNNNKCDKTQIKPIIRIKPNIPANVEKPQNKNYDESKQNKSRVSLQKKNEGLFLMTFPDPDEEIDFDDKLSQSQVSKSGTSSESANNLISKQSTTESSSQSMKQSQSVSMKKYDTYLFPPIPTVIVSNYCSDASSLNLSHTYFQNEITHQHAIKNSTTLSNTVNSNPVISLSNTVAPMSNTIAYQNSSISTNFTSNNSTPIRTFPFNNNNQMKSILNTEAPNSVNNISILPTSVPAGSSTVLSKTPISLSNVTISNLLSKTPVPASMAVLPNMSISANTVTILPKVSVPSNSVTILPKASSSITMLPIVTSVISLSDKNSALTYKIKENLPSSFSSDNFVNSLLSEIKINNVTSLKDDQSLLNSEPATYKDINKRLPSDSDTDENASFENKSHSSAKRKKLTSGRFSSDYSEPSDREDVTKKSIAIEKDNPDNLTSNNQPSDSPEKEKSTESNSNDQKEQESSGSKESDKSSDDKEKTTPQSAISVTQSAIDLLGAISILAVIDLEQNPQKGLNVRIQVAKSQLNKLTSEKISTPEHNERIASCQYNLTLLNIAKKYLSIYGTFAKVSDHLLRKANMANMIQIKKELHEEETNQSSCMFSQPTHLNTSFSDRQSDVSRTVQMSPVNNQMQNFASSRPAAQTPINHIEKLKSQIAAMNNVNINNVDLSQYGIFPGGGTIHHYPVEQIAALNHAVAAPAPMMPRNDCLGNESRETPSRGSGPRTPARPESAASQSEDTASLIQIKKEQFETTTSPSSQCAYAQNTTLPQISSQLPVMPEMPTLMPQHSIPNTPMHIPVSNANQAYTNQTNYSIHSSGMAPNRTVAYSHQNYSDMYVNVTSKPQMQITPATTSAEMRQNQQVLLGQQMYIQNGSGLCSKQAVPSVNNNQYVIRPPYTTANTGGTLIVNNTQVGQNALLTNVSNQQFYTSNQVSQLYYPPSAQMTCMPNNNMPTMITQDVTAAQVQQAESPEQMICAVCNKQATLRCKQCARVAYCNTACAKTYWHQKHKMECKPVGS